MIFKDSSLQMNQLIFPDDNGKFGQAMTTTINTFSALIKGNRTTIAMT